MIGVISRPVGITLNNYILMDFTWTYFTRITIIGKHFTLAL